MNNLTVVLRLYNEQYNDSPLGEWGTLSLENCNMSVSEFV